MPPKKRQIPKQQQTGECRKKIDLETLGSFNEPEEDYLYSTPYYDKAVVLKPQDIKQKLMIASNITQECKEIRKSLTDGKSVHGKLIISIERLHEFTSLPGKELKSIWDQVSSRDRSFSKTLQEVKAIYEPFVSLLADDIRTIFFKYMCEDRFPARKMDLLKDLKNMYSSYLHENMSIQRLVRNKLIKYQLFPELNRYLITEHPERVYQRTMYLKQVRDLRLQGKNFVYVEVKRIVPRGSAAGFIAGLAASPTTETLEKFFTKDSTELIAKKWLQQRILPMVPENSVVIIGQPKNRANPTCMSTKSELMEWLYLNDVPYERNSHKAVLYQLFTKYKSKVKQHGPYDHVFLNAGIPVIDLPQEWPTLNFFWCIWSGVDILDMYQPSRPETLKQKILSSAQLLKDMKKTETTLIERELKLTKEDNAMETVIEKIRVMAKDGELQLSDFPKECCGDKTDYFETNICKCILE